jgi:type IV pilus assembly protein PilA
MYKILTNRRDREDRDGGFTLIELMVVVLIIAVLLAIAIPTFLGAQSTAKDRGAQSAARNALTNAKTIYADTGHYSGATATALLAVEPGMEFVTATATAGSSTGSKSVSVLPGDKQWYAAVLSDSGTCYYIRDSIDPTSTPGTSYGTVSSSTDTTCIATATPTGDYAASWG